MSGSGWRPIDPLDRAVETALGRDLATLDAVHRSWQEHRTEFGRLEYTYPLHRTYRKHAIETGIIKGLYDLDRPTTEVMVIKGITRGADTADEEVPPGVLQMLRAHWRCGLSVVNSRSRLSTSSRTSPWRTSGYSTRRRSFSLPHFSRKNKTLITTPKTPTQYDNKSFIEYKTSFSLPHFSRKNKTLITTPRNLRSCPDPRTPNRHQSAMSGPGPYSTAGPRAASLVRSSICRSTRPGGLRTGPVLPGW